MRLVIANDHSDVRLWCFKTNNNYPFQARIFADLCACYLSACEVRMRAGQVPTGWIQRKVSAPLAAGTLSLS